MRLWLAEDMPFFARNYRVFRTVSEQTQDNPYAGMGWSELTKNPLFFWGFLQN